MKIFISYRSLDREAVRALVRDLEDIGHEVWTDRHITGGKDWWVHILDGIHQSDLFLFGVTENWFASEACLREFDYATALNKNRVPIKLSHEMTLDRIPPVVRRLQIVDYTDGNGFRELQRAINGMPLPAAPPNPLPEPPASPDEPLAQYDQQLRQLQLERDAQSAMVIELKHALRRQQSADQARQLLENLRKHPDTGDAIANRIDRALSESPKTEPERMTEEMLPVLPTAPAKPERVAIRPGDAQHLVPLARFDGHTDAVYAVGFSPDSTLLASASGDKTVRLWNMHNGEAFAMLRGHNGAVRDLAFHPAGDMLASSAADSVVRLWQLGGAREIHELNGHDDWVLRVQFSPRGDVLAAASVDEMTTLWDAATRAPLGTLGGHGGWVTGLAFSPDNTTLATASYDGTVRLWQVARRKRLHVMFNGAGMVEDVAFAPSGTMLAAACQGGQIRLYSLAKQREIGVLEGHTHTVYRLAFSPDGSLLISGGADGTVRVWDLRTMATCAVLNGHDGGVWGVAVSPDGTLVASAGDDSSVRLWGLVS